MKRYAVKLTHGDDVKILAVYDDKLTALVAGAEYRKTISRDAGLLALIEGEFDENGQMIGTGFKMHEIFR